jgi:hypothetical protein
LKRTSGQELSPALSPGDSRERRRPVHLSLCPPDPPNAPRSGRHYRHFLRDVRSKVLQANARLNALRPPFNVCQRVPFPEGSWRSSHGIARPEPTCVFCITCKGRALTTEQRIPRLTQAARNESPRNYELQLNARANLRIRSRRDVGVHGHRLLFGKCCSKINLWLDDVTYARA